MLKKLARYLVHNPRVAYLWLFEDDPKQITICVDTDFAGCTRTRRSTSGGMVFFWHIL